VTRRGTAGLTLLEAMVALAVVATGVVATQRLVAQSARSVAAERSAARAQLAAQRLLAEARLGPLALGTMAGTTPDGVAFEREVRRGEHPALREVRVVTGAGTGAGAHCELREVLRAPADS